MQDEYRRLASRFRRGEPLDRDQLLELCRFAVENRNYVLAGRVSDRLFQ